MQSIQVIMVTYKLQIYFQKCHIIMTYNYTIHIYFILFGKGES